MSASSDIQALKRKLHDSETELARKTAELADMASQIDNLASLADRLGRQVEHLHRLATLGTLSASLAHEFRNVLQPTVVYTQIGLSELGRPQPDLKALDKALTKCSAAGDRADRLCSAVLELATPHREDDVEVDVRTAAETVRLTLGDVAARRVNVDIDPGLTLAMPAVHLEHVLLNLVLNALRATESCRGRVWIGSETSRGGVVLTVTDNGCGMTPAVAGRIFEPFYSNSGSSGLGLNLCRQMIERAGGSIAVSSTPGEGTRFEIRVDRASPEREKSSPRRAA